MSDNPDLAALEFWLPLRVVNSLNVREHWSLDAKRARAQRDAVCAGILVALGRRRISAPAARAKAVTFHAYTGNPLDSDGLQAALKHIRDGLIDAGLIHGDAPIHGHTFTYEQTSGTPAAERGVRVRVALRRPEEGSRDMGPA